MKTSAATICRLTAASAVLGLLLVVGCQYLGQQSPQPGPKPAAAQNVILVLTDDMRYDGLWVMPNLLRLAERGVTFDRAYVTTPLCCPSRASILTGRYARHHGVLLNEPPDGGVERFDDRSTLATWLQAAGVRTGLVGRYLNGYTSEAVPPGWEYWFAVGQEELSGYFDYRVTDNGVRKDFGGRPKDYATRVFGQQAIRFLERQRERPFFLVFSTRAPHEPAKPDPDDRGKLDDREIPLSPAFDEADVGDKPLWIQREDPLSDEEKQSFDAFRRRQLETLIGVDRAIEDLVETLRADGRLDRTWIIFTSDNGLTLGEHRRPTGKSCPYEECVRVPLIVVPPPGFTAPRTDRQVVANIDLAPTIAEILGATPSAPVDGRSLLPLLREPAAAWRSGILLESFVGSSREFVGLRTAERKYVWYGSGEEELYDDATDPFELENRANDPAWASQKAELRERLRALLAEIGPGVAGRSLP